MKPPFKASDSAINVIYAPWFDMSTVCFVASLSLTLNLIVVMPTCAISVFMCRLSYLRETLKLFYLCNVAFMC